MTNNFGFVPSLIPQLADLRPLNDDAAGVAPANPSDFFDLLSGVKISINLLGLTVEFTSANTFDIVENGGTRSGTYTYQHTGAQTAELKLVLDNGDSYEADLEFISATTVRAEFSVPGGLLPIPLNIPIPLIDQPDDTATPDTAPTPMGTAGDDNLPGTPGADVLEGLGGNDALFGYAGDDTLRGGAGNDTLNGGPGADVLDGGPGSDHVFYLSSERGVLVRLHDARGVRFGEAEGDTLTGIEHLTGSSFNDILAGDGENNTINGEGGDDTLYGGPEGGDDIMNGGDGDDRIFGGKGDDTLTGGEGNDLLKAGAGDDTLIADGNDMDVLYGGDGKDRFQFFPSNLGGGTIADFADGEDVIDLTAFSGIASVDDLKDNIVSLGGNVRIELKGTDSLGADYLTTIILSDFDVADLDNSDFIFLA